MKRDLYVINRDIYIHMKRDIQKKPMYSLSSPIDTYKETSYMKRDLYVIKRDKYAGKTYTKQTYV